jgi:hypothetical protein
MATATVLRIVSLAAVLVLLLGTPPKALADQVVADDLIVQGELCVGTPCVDGEPLILGEVRIKGDTPRLLLMRTTASPQEWGSSQWTPAITSSFGILETPPQVHS